MASLYDILGRDVVNDYLENSEDIVAGKLALANEFVEHARSIAPVDDGTYRDGIKARRVGRSGVGIYFTAEHSNLVEYGSVNNPEYAVMRRTIEHFNGPGR